MVMSSCEILVKTDVYPANIMVFKLFFNIAEIERNSIA